MQSRKKLPNHPQSTSIADADYSTAAAAAARALSLRAPSVTSKKPTFQSRNKLVNINSLDSVGERRDSRSLHSCLHFDGSQMLLLLLLQAGSCE